MDAREGWDAGAEAWSHFVRSGADYYRLAVHGPALLDACLPVAGLRVLDLGCGEGYFTRQLADAGASVVGIDFSDAQVRAAQAEQERAPRDVAYRVLDAAAIADAYPAGSFDLVTACMSFQDMADAAGALRGVAAVLADGGRLVFSVPHPATDTPYREWERDERGRKLALKIDRYFESGGSVMHWNMPRLKYTWFTPHWRRTLAEWSALLAEHGFGIRLLLEPRPSAEQVMEDPNLDDCARLPYFLILDTFATERRP